MVSVESQFSTEFDHFAGIATLLRSPPLVRGLRRASHTSWLPPFPVGFCDRGTHNAPSTAVCIMVCSRCGHPAAADAGQCVGCGAILPDTKVVLDVLPVDTTGLPPGATLGASTTV